MARKKKTPAPAAAPFGPEPSDFTGPYRGAGQESPYLNPVGSFGTASFPQQSAESYGPGSPFQPGPYAAPGQAPASQVKYKPQDLKTLGYAAPIGAGLGAASQVTPTTDASDAVMQTLAAGATGAAEGAATGAALGAIGGPGGALGGAVAGGIAGVVMGGMQSYLGLKRARAARREQEKRLSEVQAREDRRAQQERADAQQAQGYNRRQNAIQSHWNAMNYVVNQINNTVAQDQNLRDRFLSLGR